MRVTSRMMNRTLLRNLDRVNQEQSELITRIATGKRIQKPSDDPMSVAKVIQVRDELVKAERHQENIASAQQWLTMSEQMLDNSCDLVERAMMLATQAGSDTVDADARRNLASQVQGIIDSLLADANTIYGDSYLFAGTNSDTAPFTASKSVQETLTSPGAEESILLAYTGLNSDPVQIEADGVVYAEEGNFTVDRKTGTIRIIADGALAAAGAGSLTIRYGTESAANISSQPGQTQGAMMREIMKNQSVQINVAGEDVFAGDINIFAELTALKNALVRNDSQSIRNSIHTFEDGTDQITRYTALQGIRNEQIENCRVKLDDYILQMKSLQSYLEDNDLAEASTQLQISQTSYQAILKASSSYLNLSLLDYLG